MPLAEAAATLEAAMTAHLGAVRSDARGEGPLALARRESGRRDCLAAPLLADAIQQRDERDVHGGRLGRGAEARACI